MPNLPAGPKGPTQPAEDDRQRVPVTVSGDRPAPEVCPVATDVELIDAVDAGDRDAFEAVYDRHAGHVYGLARLMCGPVDAADIVVAVFVELWEQPRRFRDAAKPLALLTRETHRRAVGGLRRERRSRSHPTEAVVSGKIGPESLLDGEALRSVLGERLACRLSALPDCERDVVVLAYFAGYDCDELGALLGRSKATITCQIRSGLGHLRDGAGVSASTLPYRLSTDDEKEAVTRGNR